MIENILSLRQDVRHILVEVGMQEGRVTVQIFDGDTSKIHLTPYETRHLILALTHAARLAETIP